MQLPNSTFKSLAWFKYLAEYEADDLEWDWVAGMDQHGSLSIKYSHVYSVYLQEFLQITDIAKTDNGALYRCTVEYYNEPTNKSLDHETDLIRLQFKEEEGNIYTSTTELKEKKDQNIFV